MVSRQPQKVTLFIPCLMDLFYPQVGQNLVALLKQLGFQVDYPQAQTCCGQPAFNQGFIPQTRTLAQRFLTVFDSAELILCPSGSCTAMVRNHYRELFSSGSDWLVKARKTADIIFEVSEFLTRYIPLEKIKASFPYKVTYHDSCHSNRVLGIRDEPRKLLNQVKGLTLIEMESSQNCCGFGGLFSRKFPNLSQAIGDEKAEAIEKTGADYVVSNDPGCLMHIQSRLQERNSSIKTKHIIEILAGSSDHEDRNRKL